MTKTMIHIKKMSISLLVILMVFAVSMPFGVKEAKAANLTSVSDTLSTLTQNVVANHTILFVTPTGVESSTDTITIDLTDFTIGSVAFGDIDLAEDDDGNCDGTWTDKTLAASAAAGVWGAAIASSTLTLTPPTDASVGEIDAGYCVQVEIGTNATGGSNQLTNPNDTSTHVFEIAGAFGDAADFAVDFVADDSVAVTANVDPSINFAISSTSIEFGDLSSSQATWADASAGSTSDVVAHTMTIGTNATSGYVITYNGATLTSGGDTITVASITDDADGTPGTEQFGMGFSASGDATIQAEYDHNATPASRDWAFVAGTTTSIVSESGPTADETISCYYLANIASNTEAGDYSTSITYIATAIF